MHEVIVISVGSFSSSVLTEHRSFWQSMVRAGYPFLLPTLPRCVPWYSELFLLRECPIFECGWEPWPFVFPAVYALDGQIVTLFQANSFESNVCLFDSGALLIGASSYYMHPLGASWQPDRVPFFLIQRTYILGFGLVHNPKRRQKAASALREGIKTERECVVPFPSPLRALLPGRAQHAPKPGFILFSLVQELGFWSASGPWSPKRASLALCQPSHPEAGSACIQ